MVKRLLWRFGCTEFKDLFVVRDGKKTRVKDKKQQKKDKDQPSSPTTVGEPSRNSDEDFDPPTDFVVSTRACAFLLCVCGWFALIEGLCAISLCVCCVHVCVAKSNGLCSHTSCVFIVKVVCS